MKGIFIPKIVSIASIYNIKENYVSEADLSTSATLSEVPLISGEAIGYMLNELMHVSKTFQEIISTSTTRKSLVDSLI